MSNDNNIDPKWIGWTTNVADEYKGMSVEEIKSKLADKAFPYSVLMENFQGDFNISTVIRNANAFGANKVFYIGKKRYDKRGCVGTNHYTDIIHLESRDQLAYLKLRYTFVGVDNIAGSKSISDFSYKDHSLFLFGEEGFGLTKETLDMCDELVSIPQFGSVRSLNAGCASSIIMYDYTRKYQEKNGVLINLRSSYGLRIC